MRKRLLVFFLVVGMLYVCFVSTQAAVMDITPSAQLTIDGNTAICQVTIAKSGKSIQATMELWQGNTLVDSWSGNETSYLHLVGTHRITTGKTYTVTVLCTVDGKDFYVRPVSKTT